MKRCGRPLRTAPMSSGCRRSALTIAAIVAYVAFFVIIFAIGSQREVVRLCLPNQDGLPGGRVGPLLGSEHALEETRTKLLHWLTIDLDAHVDLASSRKAEATAGRLRPALQLRTALVVWHPLPADALHGI